MGDQERGQAWLWRLQCGLGWALAALLPFSAFGAEPTRVTILHTNDLHSHFRPTKDALGMGGIARLKTVIDHIRRDRPSALLLDGGDWSEGQIYYNLGAGAETLRMMDHLGYDVAVVGNHDWINGPDILLDSYRAARPSTVLVGANLDSSRYRRGREFDSLIPPYVIREVNGVRIAIIGLATYEFIYDDYFSPIKILSPFGVARELVARLKRQADAIVVISHNTIRMNRELIERVPDIDLVIGAHDHVKLTEPVEVPRDGRPPAWVVETECWGHFLGRVELDVYPRPEAEAANRHPVVPVSYGLIAMDNTVPEDPETVRRIEVLERAIERRYGPVFTDRIAESEIEIYRADKPDNLMGNLAADAMLRASNADISLSQVQMIYGSLHRGPIHTADVFNADPAIYDPRDDKAWTIKTFSMEGRTLRRLMNTLFSTRAVASQGILNAAGLELTYDPMFQSSFSGRGRGLRGRPPRDLSFFFDEPESQEKESGDSSIIRDFRVGGEPLDPRRIYEVAISDGLLKAIRILNSLFPDAIPLTDLRETGIESWRSIARHVRELSPVRLNDIPVGNRIRSLQPDVAVLYDDVTWERPRFARGSPLDHARAVVRVRIRNLGANPVPAGSTGVRLLGNRNGADMTVNASWALLGDPRSLAPLAPGETQTLEWSVTIPGHRGIFPVRVELVGNDYDVNSSNDQIVHYFRARDLQ